MSPTWNALKRSTTHAMKLCGEGLKEFEDITIDVLQVKCCTISSYLHCLHFNEHQSASEKATLIYSIFSSIIEVSVTKENVIS